MNLRRTIFGVVAGAALMALAAPQGVDAQIADQFTIGLVPRIYQPQTGRGTVIPRADFRDLFNGLTDPDNGVAGPIFLPPGFEFEYDGQVFTQIYISVNGWVSFRNPLTTGGAGFFGDDPLSLFSSTRPNLTLAPYFGDHYLRTVGFDATDPGGRAYTPSAISYGSTTINGDSAFFVEWRNLNINYRFDPTDPDNPFAPINQVQPQASSIGTFQLYLVKAPAGSATCRPAQGAIEFHYGPVGNTGVVKVSGSSVGIEDAPKVALGQTTFINAVGWLQTGQRMDSATLSRRLTREYPPTGFPSQAFRFQSRCLNTIGGWGDGDADLTQLDPNAPAVVRQDQRLFVSFADVIRILRHQATRNVEFDYIPGRHGYHGDVNHNGRFFYSTRTFDNLADTVDQFGNIIRYIRRFPEKSTNPDLPLPNDNSFAGFLFDADQHDAALIMLYLAAKLPVLPWLPDTLPPFTGKRVSAYGANDVVLGTTNPIGKTVEIPVTFNGLLNGALGVAMEATNGTRIVEVRTKSRTNTAWVEAASSDNRVALAAAGAFQPNDVVATLVVEANENGDVTFQNVVVGEQEKGTRKFNIFRSGVGTVGTGSELSLANFPNPFSPNMTTTISYSVPTEGPVVMRVFNVLGREVTKLVDVTMPAGSYTADWNGLDASGKVVAPGLYYCRIEANGESRTIPMHVVQ